MANNTNISPEIIIVFQNTDRIYWLGTITKIHEKYSGLIDKKQKEKIGIDFDESISRKDIKPFHLVTLACLIHFLINIKLRVLVSNKNRDVFQYIFTDLGFPEYWKGGKNHIEATNQNSIFNLWRIVENEKDLYAKHVENYLKSRYFANKDLSAISEGLVEAYYNVFDHAQAKGNAFSLIQFDEETNILYIAVSDFGIGIAQSVINYDKSIKTDKEAILKALEENFTVGSTNRNKGMGLNNIIDPAKEARIFSHKGLVYKHDSNIEGYDCNISFPGTLIYYEIDLSQMEDEERIDEFIF